MRGLLLAVAATGCAAEVDTMTVRVEPAAIVLVADPFGAPPSQTLQVLAGDRDVTTEATFALSGDPIGSLAGATFTSDGVTGGAGTIAVDLGATHLEIPIAVDIHSARVLPGVTPVAQAAFATAMRSPSILALEPGDGAVVPANLGGLDVDFGALDTDDVHEIAFTAPHLDVRVYAPGVPGPRHLELARAEWRAIAATARGASVALDVASLSAAALDTARTLHAQLGVADLPAKSLWFTGAEPSVPSLWRYDVAAGRSAAFAGNADGTCMGCHVAVSPDGARVIAARAVPLASVPVVVDVASGTVSPGDSSLSWGSAAFAPGGQLVTATNGALALRDGTTFAPIASFDPTILATTPRVSPDGHRLVFTGLAVPTLAVAGPALRVAAFDANGPTLGTPVDLLDAGEGEELMEPDVSLDSQWVVIARVPDPAISGSYLHGTISVVSLDGGAPIDLDGDSGVPRFASAVAPARAGGATEPMTWIAITSLRPIGARAPAGGQLWLFAYWPGRGLASRAFHLPGQPADLHVIHAAGRAE